MLPDAARLSTSNLIVFFLVRMKLSLTLMTFTRTNPNSLCISNQKKIKGLYLGSKLLQFPKFLSSRIKISNEIAFRPVMLQAKNYADWKKIDLSYF